MTVPALQLADFDLSVRPQDDLFRHVNGAWLEATLAGTSAQVSYQHGLVEMLREVRGHTAGVLIRPTSVEEILRTGREGLLMPPKSTFFTPKLRTGLVIRTL